MEEVVEESAGTGRGTGTVPVSFLRGTRRATQSSQRTLLCGGYHFGPLRETRPAAPGHAPCSQESLQPIPAMAQRGVRRPGSRRYPGHGLSGEARRAVCKGRSAPPSYSTGLTSIPTTGRAETANCSSECFHCPAATAHLPGNVDPHRIDDFTCAFTTRDVPGPRAFNEKTGRSSPGRADRESSPRPRSVGRCPATGHTTKASAMSGRRPPHEPVNLMEGTSIASAVRCA